MDVEVRYNNGVSLQQRMRYLSAHAQHIGSRRYQQDAFLFTDPSDEAFAEHAGYLAVICDGMGGMEHGDLASQAATSTLVAEYAKKVPSESILDALTRSALEANNRVVSIAAGLGVREGMGTTLVAAVVHEGTYHFISIGDSALFHVREGKAELVNLHHIFGNLLDRAAATGSITQEQADEHPERESLTSFIGMATLEEIDRNRIPLLLNAGDTLLLATDGLFKTLDPSEIEAVLDGHPQSWPSRLVAATLDKRRPGQDNVTVLSVTAAPPGLRPWDDAMDKAVSHSQSQETRIPLPLAPVPEIEQPAVRMSLWMLVAAILAIVLLAAAAAYAGWTMGSAR